jgi:1,4-dihydroxy-2-naphthoyl-CoA hydrolase
LPFAKTAARPRFARGVIDSSGSGGVGLAHGRVFFRAWFMHPRPVIGPEESSWTLLGLTIVSVAPDCVKAELPVREDLCTRPAVLHGGAVMAFADTLGAVATIANLPEGAGTTTIESKTNFFAAIPLGDTAKAECTPLHRGRTTMVWQTRITRGDGRLAAVVTQTQLVLKKGE